MSSQTQDVSIIMLTCPGGAEDIVAQGRSYSLDFVGGDTHANASSTNQNAFLEIASGYGPTYFPGDIGVVYSLSAMTAEVLIGMAVFDK